MAAFAMGQRTLLKHGRERVGFWWLVGTAYVGTAISVFLPFVGSSISSGYTIKQARRRNISELRTTAALAANGAVALTTFGTITVVGAVSSHDPLAATSAVVLAALAAGAAAGIGLSLRSERGRKRLQTCAEAGVRLMNRCNRRTKLDPVDTAARTVARLQQLYFPPSQIAQALGWSLLNWTANIAVLAFAITATSSPIPWAHLLLVWSAGVAAAGISPLPGGIGIVEATLITSLAAAHLPQQHAIVAVILYRVVSLQPGRTLVSLLATRSSTRFTTYRNNALRNQQR